MVNKKVLLGVLGVVVAVQAMDPILTEISITGDYRVKGTTTYGNYVYTAYANNKQVGIYNVQDPVNPVLLSRFGVSNDKPYKVEVVGTILYVRYRNNIQTFTLANPENPVHVSTHTPGCDNYEFGANDLAFSGDYLYIACRGKVVTLLTDTSGALTHVADTSLTHTSNYNYPLVFGTKLFVINLWRRITTIDITNPAAPVWVAQRGGYTGEFYSAKVLNGELYVAGYNPAFRKIDATTLNVIPTTLPNDIASMYLSTAIDIEAPYIYISTYFNNGMNGVDPGLYVLTEESNNVFTLVEKHVGKNSQDIEVMDGQLIAANKFSHKWYIFSAPSQCTAEGPMVVINEEVVAGVDLAGATTYTSGSKQLERIPTNFRSMQVHMPETDVFAGSLIELKCCGTEVCEFVLSHYHCPPCSGTVNGRFPKDLPDKGFEAGSCAPKYGATEERMTSYRVQVQPRETLMLDPLAEDATSFAIFSQQGALPDPWCPAKEGRPGCGGPCPPNVCKCFDTHNELVALMVK